MKKLIIGLALGIAGGFALATVLLMSPRKPTHEWKPEPVQADISPTKEKLQTILDSEYTEYLRLKTMEEKFKKADEILEKVIAIFLADLQLHFERPRDEVPASTLAAATPVPTPVTALPLTAPVASTHQNRVGRGGIVVATPRSLPSQAMVTRFLESQKPENFKTIWKDSRPIKTLPPNLQGCFAGRGIVDTPAPGDNWEVRMFYAEGLSLITMISPHIRSVTRGKGNLKGVRGIPQDENAIVLEASPDVHFQIFYLADQDQWVGNIYRKERGQPNRHIGTLNLRRGTDCGA